MARSPSHNPAFDSVGSHASHYRDSTSLASSTVNYLPPRLTNPFPWLERSPWLPIAPDSDVASGYLARRAEPNLMPTTPPSVVTAFRAL
mmetsp:Transcript_37949/g.100346  ORF Transcript_37949/g.100346 Transcript_37949/m.100346 type:complete len:89 (-) Transcript_37949:124-390(-)